MPTVQYPGTASPLDDQVAAKGCLAAEGWLQMSPFPTVVAYDDVRSFLLDDRVGVDAARSLELAGITGGPLHDFIAISPLNSDGEEHRRWRSEMVRIFTPRRAAELRPFLEGVATELVDVVSEGGGRCELMAEVAEPFALRGLCELIGVPREDCSEFEGWASDVGRLLSSVFEPGCLHELEAALEPLLTYTDDLLMRRASTPTGDLVSLVAERIEGNPSFPPGAGRMTVAGLIFTGLETVKCQLGWSVATLALAPELWRAAGERTVGMPQLVEELLRHRSVNGTLARTARSDIEHRGHTFPAGSRLFLSIWGADNDPNAFPDAHQLRLMEADRPHLAFGLGQHYCIGASLARVELAVALSELTSRLDCPTIADVSWKPSVPPTGPASLVLDFPQGDSTSGSADSTPVRTRP